jgi:hypothetical protein
MTHAHYAERTVSDRVSAAMAEDDPQLLAELRALERIALGRSVAIAANGRFPHWSPERWFAVLTFCMALFGTLFLLGGDWQSVKHDMTAMKVDMDQVKASQLENQQKLDALKAQIETIEKADEWYRTHPRAPAQFGRQ